MGTTAYTYDPAGNRLSRVRGSSTAYAYDRADRITSAGGSAVTVDAVGDLTARGSDTFTYDQPNRLTVATVAGVGETYAYDGDGVRFSRQVGANPATRHVSDVNQALPVTLDDGIRKYVWGRGLAYAVAGSTLEVYHADRLGSIRAITDASGAVTATYRTDEWGVPTATTGSSTQPYAYTGEPRDATGLTYLRARYYDPSLGRFMSRDKLAGSEHDPLSLNRYCYGRNNPATLADPSGYKALVLDPQTEFCLGGVVAGPIGLAALGIIDTGIAIANVLALGLPIAEVALIPVDVAAITATYGMYSVVEQSTHRTGGTAGSTSSCSTGASTSRSTRSWSPLSPLGPRPPASAWSSTGSSSLGLRTP